jgi:hypothetical protein
VYERGKRRVGGGRGEEREVIDIEEDGGDKGQQCAGLFVIAVVDFQEITAENEQILDRSINLPNFIKNPSNKLLHIILLCREKDLPGHHKQPIAQPIKTHQS